jgi:hypothetical protein
VASTPNESDDDASLDKDDDQILEEMRSRFDLCQKAWSENRNNALDDLNFIDGKQWHESDEASRREDGRPCLTINKLPQVVNQVTNDQRQNRPSIKVYPVDDEGDVETAKVYSGIIRHIEYISNAEAAYDTAFEFAAKMGWGFWRVVTEYSDPESFDQDIVIKRIPNPFSVHLDPHSVEPDGSDANYAFVVEDLSKDEYKRIYPKSEITDPSFQESVGESSPWINADSCRVAEYFYKENEEATLHMLTDGTAILEEDFKTAQENGQIPEGITIAKSRTTQIPKIKWVKTNGVEVLEQTEWLGKYIPIIPSYGSDSNIGGKRVLKGIVRDAKDSARMYNYFASAETEAIALAPKAPFIADPKQIEGYEQIWATANRKNHSYLPYNMMVGNQMIPPPSRSSSEVSTQAITQARMLASDDIKATTGIYDASLGNKSNETSGVAIQKRNVQAQTSNYHFIDNLTRSLRHTGRIIVDLIPKIYDTARAQRIIGDDGNQKIVQLNAPYQDENGEVQLFKLDDGTYDVTVDVGPSFQTKRQEATSSMLELSKSAPQMMQIAPDLIVKNMDFPGAQELADRFKKTLPPNLLDDGKPQPVPPQVQQQMQHMGQMVDELTKHLHAAQDKIDRKTLELESRERIELKKLEVELEIAMAQMGAKDSLALLNHEIESISTRLNLLHSAQPVFTDYEDMQQMQQAPQPSQNQPPNPMNGGQPASQGMGAQPTGGQSPGLPMQGPTQ